MSRTIKVLPDAADRYSRIAALWSQVRMAEERIEAAKLDARENTKEREELLAKIGSIIEDQQLALPLTEAESEGAL